MTTVFIISGTTYSVPSDWSATNTIEVIAAGGSGGNSNSGSHVGTGGGGGGYSKLTNTSALTPSATVGILVGAGGGAISTTNTNGTAGGNTFFASDNTGNASNNTGSGFGSSVIVAANGGGGGGGGTPTTGGAGGSTTLAVGGTKSAGGSGGAIGGDHSAGTGGGGAAGPGGGGQNGGTNNVTSDTAGAGGGGAGGGSSTPGVDGGIAGASNAGAGGNGPAGSGGGAAGVGVGGSGSNGGGGGGGGAGSVGGVGGTGTEWDASHGAGGGGGGGGGGNGGGNAANYGGGGGATGYGGSVFTSGAGAQGIIVLIYTPSGTSAGGARIRQRWNRSVLAYPAGAVPGFDRNHPAAQSCTFSGIATQGGTFGNILSRVKGTENGTKTTSLYSSLGPATNYTIGSSDNTIFPFVSAASAPITMATILKMSPGSPGINTMYALNNSAAGNVGIGDVDATGAFSGFHELSGAQQVSTGVSYVIGVPYFFAMSFSLTLINWVVARLDTGQVFTGQVANTTGVIDAGDGNITVGSRSGNSRQLGGGIAAAMASNAFMSQQQLRSWAADPWAFWYPNNFKGLLTTGATPPAFLVSAVQSWPSLGRLIEIIGAD